MNGVQTTMSLVTTDGQNLRQRAELAAERLNAVKS